jgi:DNA-binding transcriptional MerR regulator
MKPLTIGQVADSAGVGVESVRFYERQGPLEEPARRESGDRQYPEDVVARLAECGIGVTEALVRQVKVERLQEAAKVERQKVTVPDRCQRRQLRLPPKIPPSR